MGIYFNEFAFNIYRDSIVTEAYIGKTPTLLEIENQIGVIREKAVKKYTDINRSKEVQDLNRLFEKQFGMEIFSLHVEQNSTINAYTIPIATRFDIAFKDMLSRKIEANQKDGYRFKSGNNLCIICNIYLGLLNCPDLSNAEILAIILHELGHNFADAIYKDIEIENKSTMRNIISLLVLEAILTFGLYLIPNIKYYITNQNKYQNKKEKKETKKKQSKLGGLITGIKAKCSDFNDYINEIITRICGGAGIESYKLQYSEKEKEEIKNSMSRQNEVIADKFAGIYGYGPELSSALIKMNKQVSKAEKFVSSKLGNFGKIMNDSFNDACKDLYKYDCHPHVIQRLNEEIKTLKSELSKSDLDPKLVTVMNKQVKQLEDLLKEVTKLSDKLPTNENERAQFFSYINDQDPDAVDEEVEKRITKAFDDLLK